MKMPTVALVGRPNVGKSTIFNRLVGERISIIEDTPGVTRDRIYGDVSYLNYKFHLIDTGGIDVSKELFNDEIKIQTSIAIDEADIVVFIVDGKEELNRNDFVIRDMLRKANKEVIIRLIVKKEKIIFIIFMNWVLEMLLELVVNIILVLEI